jgi:hypothetical protein
MLGLFSGSKPHQFPKGAFGITDQPTIYRAAKVLIDQHGNEAPIFAAMRNTPWRSLRFYCEWCRAGGLAGEVTMWVE